MARSTPPPQPPVNGGEQDEPELDHAAFVVDHGPRPEHDGAAPTPRGSGSTAVTRGGGDEPLHERGSRPRQDHGATVDQEVVPPAVQVNDASKVSRVDTGQLEAVPEAGGRFSTWRARRRAARTEEQEGSAAREGAGDPEQDGATVLHFPAGSGRARRRKRLLGLLVTLLVLAALLVAVFVSPLFATRTIDVQGATLTDPQTVQDALADYEGVPMTRISKQDVMASVGNVPQVKSVDVAFRPPHTMSVQLHERVGVAVVEDGSSMVLVDSEGKPLSTVPAAQRPDVPLIAGGRGVLSTQRFQDISQVLAALPADVLSRLDGAAAPSGSTVELTFKDGRRVRWGDASDSELKAQVVASLVNSRTADSAKLIDVSAPLHPVLT